MPDIWKNDRGYLLLRRYVDPFTKASYSSFKVEGGLPDDGRAVIIAPNHCNTLMDALVVLRSRPLEATVFGARADIFRKAGRALRFLKILPLARERDGAGTIRECLGSFEEVDQTLAAGVPFCLFPEGRHRPGRTLLPIQKGVARMAFRSARERPTVVVPAGINYSHFFRYRGACVLRYGEPIDVNAFLDAHADEAEAAQYQAFREELSQRIQALVDPQPIPFRRRWWVLPLWPLAALLSLPLWATAEWLCHRKIKDQAFHNTARFGIKLVGTPLFALLWAILLFCLLPWPWALALLVLYLFSFSLFYDGLHLFRQINEGNP